MPRSLDFYNTLPRDLDTADYEHKPPDRGISRISQALMPFYAETGLRDVVLCSQTSDRSPPPWSFLCIFLLHTLNPAVTSEIHQGAKFAEIIHYGSSTLLLT